MKELLVTETALAVSPVTSVLLAQRVNAFNAVGILVKNTGAFPITVWVATRLADSGPYATRPVDDLVDIPAGEAKQFDADIGTSQWLALLAVASGGASTADVNLLFVNKV